ncbi:hypothetical protein PHLCEN_2v12265 [Hermanssonia centrifuga]|uniref:Uncharacterized protein n=1 Tax=Hermanssonia centrifuga TaxID=98765 RepID=A0A2R6NHU6_9APHY|nr:hypothetical protein PHLCEN_2v12265 [Hermanssonia centrifuga]
MGADLDHDTAEEVDDEAEDVDVSSRNEAFVDGPALAQNVFNETQEILVLRTGSTFASLMWSMGKLGQDVIKVGFDRKVTVSVLKA